MAFQVPKSKASIRQNRFEFQVEEGGKTYDLPLMKYLPVRVIEAMNDTDRSFGALLSAFGDGEAAEAVRDLDAEQLNALMEAWEEESGITAGESAASSKS